MDNSGCESQYHRGIVAGSSGQYRVQTYQRKSEEEQERKVLIRFIFAGFLALLACLIFWWRKTHFYTSSSVFVVEVTGNVIREELCVFSRKPSLKDLFECGGGSVQEVTLGDFDICNGCKVYLPYPGEEVKVEKMHVMVLHALGMKKCLSEASLEEIESLPGIGTKKARVIASYVLSGQYSKGAPWPRGIGVKTREILWAYFDDCRDRR